MDDYGEELIEVLSDSTESYDRGEKFFNCRQIDSLKEYVMVWQNMQKIEKYYRADNTLWTLSETDEDNQFILLDSIGCKLELVNVYDKVVTG
jgi:Uma2 family endonuclease